MTSSSSSLIIPSLIKLYGVLDGVAFALLRIIAGAAVAVHVGPRSRIR